MFPAPDLSTLCHELDVVGLKWFMIGIHLGVPYNKLKVFEKEEYPLAAVLDYCLRGNVKDPLTWRSIINTLKSDSVGENGLAETLDQKYCLKEQQDLPHCFISGEEM